VLPSGNKNKEGLQSLFAGISRLARHMGYIDLQEVVTDGTRMKADGSRHTTSSREEIEKWLARIEDQIKAGLKLIETNDNRDDRDYGASVIPHQLPLQGLIKRERQLKKAVKAVKKIEKKRAEHGEAAPEKEAKVSVSDPDARILPNKEGGYAPNYTPVISTDGKNGLIVDADVTASTAESPVQRQAVDRIEEIHGDRPEYMIGDGLYTDLENVQLMEEKGVTLLIPVKPAGASEEDVAYRVWCRSLNFNS